MKHSLTKKESYSCQLSATRLYKYPLKATLIGNCLFPAPLLLSTVLPVMHLLYIKHNYCQIEMAIVCAKVLLSSNSAYFINISVI